MICNTLYVGTCSFYISQDEKQIHEHCTCVINPREDYTDGTVGKIQVHNFTSYNRCNRTVRTVLIADYFADCFPQLNILKKNEPEKDTRSNL